jgi:hypothetical protein
VSSKASAKRAGASPRLSAKRAMWAMPWLATLKGGAGGGGGVERRARLNSPHSPFSRLLCEYPNGILTPILDRGCVRHSLPSWRRARRRRVSEQRQDVVLMLILAVLALVLAIAALWIGLR